MFSKFKANFLSHVGDASRLSVSIDILRALAIVLVIGVHVMSFTDFTGGFRFTPESSWGLFKVLEFGAAGVGVFFFLSGFLLDFLYREKFNTKKYVARRLGRLFPAWLLWNLVAMVVAWLGLSWAFPGGTDIMKYVYGSSVPPTSWGNVGLLLLNTVFLGWFSYRMWNLFVPGGWSIQTEVYHYTLFPFINKVGLKLPLIGLFFMQVLALALHEQTNLSMVSAVLTSPYWFVSGIIVSRLLRVLKKDSVEKPLTSFEWIVYGLTTLVTLTVAGPAVEQYVTFIVLIVCILIAVYFYKVKYFSNMMVKVGKYSYGMYFNHFFFAAPAGFAVSYLMRFVAPEYSLFYIFFLLTVAFFVVSFLSYWLAKFIYKVYEGPVLDWVRRKF